MGELLFYCFLNIYIANKNPTTIKKGQPILLDCRHNRASTFLSSPPWEHYLPRMHSTELAVGDNHHIYFEAAQSRTKDYNFLECKNVDVFSILTTFSPDTVLFLLYMNAKTGAWLTKWLQRINKLFW